MISNSEVEEHIKELCEKENLFPKQYYLGIKKAIASKGYPSNASSPVLDEYSPSYESDIHQRIKFFVDYLAKKKNKAGIILSEECDEFSRGSSGIFSRKLLKNPYNDSIVGGSSSEGAFNLLLKRTLISICSDTGGSSRFPALLSRGLIVALKPGFNKISKKGLIEYCGDLDTISLMALEPCYLTFFYSLLSNEKITNQAIKIREIIPFNLSIKLLEKKQLLKEYYCTRTELYCWSNIQRYDGRRFNIFDDKYPVNFDPSASYIPKGEIERVSKLTKNTIFKKIKDYEKIKKECEVLLDQLRTVVNNEDIFYLRIFNYKKFVFPESSNGMSDDDNSFLILENLLGLPCIFFPGIKNQWYYQITGPKDSEMKLLTYLSNKNNIEELEQKISNLNQVYDLLFKLIL